MEMVSKDYFAPQQIFCGEDEGALAGSTPGPTGRCEGSTPNAIDVEGWYLMSVAERDTATSTALDYLGIREWGWQITAFRGNQAQN